MNESERNDSDSSNEDSNNLREILIPLPSSQSTKFLPESKNLDPTTILHLSESEESNNPIFIETNNNIGEVQATSPATYITFKPKADLIINNQSPIPLAAAASGGGSTRTRKKSEEGKKLLSEKHHRKSSGIPVGIAVAWQRHVTNHSTNPTSPKHQIRGMSSPPLKPKRSPASPKARTTTPVPPSKAASEGKIKSQLEYDELKTRAHKISSPTRSPKHGSYDVKKHLSGDLKEQDRGGGADLDSRDSTSAVRDRLLVTPNSNTGYFPSAAAYHRYQYGDWNHQLLVPPPNHSQQSYNAAIAAAYMQHQISTLQSTYGYPYLYSGGYSAATEHLLQYEQYMHLQDHYEQQQRRLDYEICATAPVPVSNLSPRVSIPSPSPNYPPGNGPWTPDLYNNHTPHPLALISSATLSPRSLASSTPSPITTYESIHKKCLTPNPTPLKASSLLPKSFSPLPVSLVTHGRSNSKVSRAGGEILENPKCNDDSMDFHQKETTVKGVDYSRMESLIEKRGESSVRLLEHRIRKVKKEILSLDEEDEVNEEIVIGAKKRDGAKINNHDVPESKSVPSYEEIEKTSLKQSISNPGLKNNQNGEMEINRPITKEKEEENDDDKYFKPIEAHPDLSIYKDRKESNDNKNSKDDDDIRTTPGQLNNFSFPKIIISPEESHLNLLATVAQEIGPYIDMNPNPLLTPRRFENLDSIITIQSSSDDEGTSKRRLSNASSNTSCSNSLTMSQSIITTNGAINNTPAQIQGGSTNNITNTNEEKVEKKLSKFQLKIPQIFPRLSEGFLNETKNKAKKLNKGTTTVMDESRAKKLVKSFKVKRESCNKKSEKKNNIGMRMKKKPRILNKKISIQDHVNLNMKSETRDSNSNFIEGNILTSDGSTKFGKDIIKDTMKNKIHDDSIYDFDFEDTKPPLESFKKFTTQEKFQNGNSKLNFVTPITSILKSDLKKTEEIKSNLISKPKIVKQKKEKEGEKVLKISRSRNSSPKKLRTATTATTTTPATQEVENAESINLVNNSTTGEFPIRPVLDSLILNPDSSNDSSPSFGAWTTNPIHAVSAIKIPEKDPPSSSLQELKSSFHHISYTPPSSPKRKRKNQSSHHHHIKPCLKAEPVVRKNSAEDVETDSEDELLDINDYERITSTIPVSSSEIHSSNSEKIKIRKPSIDMNIFSRRHIKSSEDDEKEVKNEWDEKVVIEGVGEMIDEMRVLTEIQGLFYTGKLNALQPPDVYGVTLDNERGAPPHMIFSAEEVLEKCIREAKPWDPSQLPHGLRICAYWSPMYSGLYPGRVSTDYNLKSDLVPVEFDDGDTGVIKIGEIRLLAPNHPVREYDPNPLLTLEKKHRKRRHSSAAGSQSGCNGEHDEDDCGEAYCAKIARLQETEEEDYARSGSNVFKYWAWSGLGYKLPKTKQNRHKEFFPGIQRGDEIINVGDSAIFISEAQNRRPFLGRVEKFWEKKGLKSVTVRWFYHPEEVKTKKKVSLKYPGALFESPHIDDNDVQTIAKKCEVLDFVDFKEKYGMNLLGSKSGGKSQKPPPGIYYIAGYYDPFTSILKMKDLK